MPLPILCVVLTEDVAVADVYLKALQQRDVPTIWQRDLMGLVRLIRGVVPTVVVVDQRFLSRASIVAALGQHARAVKVLTFVDPEASKDDLLTAVVAATSLN